MTTLIDEDKKCVLENWQAPRRKLARVSRPVARDSSWAHAIYDADRESDDSNIAPQLKAVLDARSHEDVFSVGVAAIEWLKKSQENHRVLFLRGFARVLSEKSKTVDSVTPNMIVGLEILTRFGDKNAIVVLREEIVKRPVTEQHLFLVGLCHDLQLQPTNVDALELLSAEISRLLAELLDEGEFTKWQSHLIVEATRVLANLAPHILVGECGHCLINVGELEMTAVLNAFLFSAGKARDRLDLRAWSETASRLWQKYVEHAALANAEGIFASLLNYYLLLGESVDVVIARAAELPNSTDVLYMLGIDGPKTNDRDQLLKFYKHIVGLLIQEGQSKALARIWLSMLERDIKPSEFLVIAE